jgi:hypothetical protein
MQLSNTAKRVIAARQRLDRHLAHLLDYRKARSGPVRAGEIENAVELVALTAIDTCKRARGMDSVVVGTALARLDELSLELDGLCRRLTLTEASA